MPDPLPPELSGYLTDVQVTYGTGVLPSVPIPPDVGNLAAVQGYIGWGMTTDYQFASGLVQQDVCGPPGTAAEILRRSAGCCRKVITAVGIRIGEQPVMPSPDTGSPNETLGDMRVVAFNPQPMPGGTPVYGVLVMYTFLLAVPPSLTDMLDCGTTPLSTQPASAYRLNPAAWSAALIGPAAGVTGGSGSQRVTY